MTSSQTVNHCATISLLMLMVSKSTGEPEVIGANRVRRSDDVTVVSLQAVVMQQAAVIQTLQTKVAALENTSQVQGHSLGALNNNVQALQTKVDINANTVAFSARMSHDGAMTPGQTLIFDSTVTNVGKAYNTHTGIFTAPVAGTYAFFLSAMSADKHPAIHLAISKNGARLDRVYAEGMSDSHDQGSSLVSTHLVKGDRVWVHQEAGDSVRGNYWTVFTGYLLQAK